MVDIRELDPFLGVYPTDAQYSDWLALTGLITEKNLQACSASKGKGSLSYLHEMEFSGVDLKNSYTTYQGVMTPATMTKYSLDKSLILEHTANTMFGGEVKALLGELQLSFVCLIVGTMMDGLEAWKKWVQVFCTSEEYMSSHPTVIRDFLGTFPSKTSSRLFFETKLETDVVQEELQRFPDDLFTDILLQENFLTLALKTLHENILSIADGRESQDNFHTLRNRSNAFWHFLKNKFDWEFEEPAARRR